MSELFEQIKAQATQATLELLDIAKLCAGQIVVIGCSSSEIRGHRIGSNSNPEVGKAVFEAIHDVLVAKNIYLAAQCCEHLNRAIIVERAAVPLAEPVNVVPYPKAGGAFATAAYKSMKDPIAVETIKADAGLDIGSTLIGMHLKHVAIPLRLKTIRIGEAMVSAARTRPKYIGGV
ncbi:MAG TPA: TIGR01440 family protein, partial [Clostridia bacterium]|nr:TIGR01440 family protein [Clostridia bacterium]